MNNPQKTGNWEEYAEHSLTHDPEPEFPSEDNVLDWNEANDIKVTISA